jgi:hypothetical protein
MEVKWNDKTGLPETVSGNESRRYQQALQMFQDTGDDSVPFDKFFENFKSGHPKTEYIQQKPALQLQPQPQLMNDNMIRELSNKLSGIEKENKDFQDYIKKLMINENPRIVDSIFPIRRNYYDPRLLIDAAVSNEYEKRRIAEQTLSKLRDIYGEDAPGKYLERSLHRVELPKVEYGNIPEERSKVKLVTSNENKPSRSRSKTKEKKSAQKEKKSAQKAKKNNKK